MIEEGLRMAMETSLEILSQHRDKMGYITRDLQGGLIDRARRNLAYAQRQREDYQGGESINKIPEETRRILIEIMLDREKKALEYISIVEGMREALVA